jgi:molybdate transport system substrate-binding protein
VSNPILSLILFACPSVRTPPVEITVYAAASLRDALKAIAAEYEKDGKAKIVFNFGSSGDLSRQILAAGKADLFLSADEKEMDKVAADGRLEEGTRKNLLSNQLAVIEWIDPEDPPSSFFIAPFARVQLTRAHIRRIAVADPETVPAGRYAKEWLGVYWPSLEKRVVPAVDVRAALAAVESGAAQVGIVYRTDAATSKKVRVVYEVPAKEAPAIVYVLAVLQKRPNAAEVRRFADYLSSETARKSFERFGFLVPKEK